MATDEAVVWNVSDDSDDCEPRLHIVDTCEEDKNRQVI